MTFSICNKCNQLGISFFILLTLGAWAAHLGFAQQNRDFAGDYVGSLPPLHVKLHIIVGSDGSVSASVDSPDQQLFALPCADININGQALSFSVPNVHGEWTGVISSDRTSLSGVWKQGRPMALNFTRVSEPTSGNTPSSTAAPPVVARPTPTGGTLSQRPPCTVMLGASYWDGSAWKPMVIAAHLGGEHGVSFKEGLKNPFNNRAGITNILTFKNPAAALTLEPSPKFCVSVPANYDPTVVMIGSIDVKKNHRELETCSGPCASKGRNTDDWMPEKRVQAVEIKRISDSAVEITPKSPLQAGQYILGGPPLIGYYDFGVADKPAQ